MAGRISGTVKWYSRDKGYGFITPDSGEDIFVSNAGIRSHDFRTLTNGQRVFISSGLAGDLHRM